MAIVANRTSGAAPFWFFAELNDSITFATYLGYKVEWTLTGPSDPYGTARAGYLPMFGAVIETPGTYSLFCRVTNLATGATVANYGPTTITVSAYTYTSSDLAIAVGTDFSWAPGACSTLQTSDVTHSTVMSTLTGGKRVLLKFGDTFYRTSADPGNVDMSGSALMGYGMQGTRDERGIWSDAPVIDVSGLAAEQRVMGWADGTVGMVIQDIDLYGSGYETGVDEAQYFMTSASGGAHVEYVLQNRIHCTGMNTPLGVYSTGELATSGIDPTGCAIANCYVGPNANGITDAGWYAGGREFLCINNKVEGTESHASRYTWVDGGYWAYNDLEAGYNSRHCVKLHAPSWGVDNDYSRDCYLEFNTFRMDSNIGQGENAGSAVSAGPQDEFHDERVFRTRVERNTFISNDGSVFIDFDGCYDYTARFNKFFFTASTPNDHDAIHVWTRGYIVSPAQADPDNGWIEHNSLYAASQTGTLRLVNYEDGTDLVVQNNAISAPSGSAAVYNTGNQVPETLNNNYTGTSPGWNTTTLEPSSASATIVGYGANIDIGPDFNGSNYDDTTPAAGAVEWYSGGSAVPAIVVAANRRNWARA